MLGMRDVNYKLHVNARNVRCKLYELHVNARNVRCKL